MVPQNDELLYGLWFSGTATDAPIWLHNEEGVVFVFKSKESAVKMRNLLFAGDEKIEVMPYSGGGPTVLYG